MKKKTLDSVSDKSSKYKEEKELLGNDAKKTEKRKLFSDNFKANLSKKKDSLKKKKNEFAAHLKKIKYIGRVPRVLSSNDRLIIKFLAGIAGIAFLAWCGNYYFKHTELVPKAGGRYIEGMIGEPKFINPVLAESSDIDKSITSFVFRGLMRFDKDLKLQNDIAEEYETSEDSKEYVFKLKKNVMWHDHENQKGLNKVVTADDVVFTIQLIQDPKYDSPLSANFDGVTVEKIDDFTVKFILENTFTPFLANTTVGILPKHIWEGIQPSSAALAEANLKPIGNGPYKFKSLEKDKKGMLQSFKLERFKEYYDTKPFIDDVTFRFYQTSELLLTAYRKKEIHGINFILPSQKDSITEKREITFYPVNLASYHAVFFNQSNSKPLQDKNVRIALSHATDRVRIISEALDGQGIEAHGPILPGFLGYNPELQKREYDKKKAEDILHENGWRDSNENGMRDKDGNELEFTIRTTDFPEHVKTTEILKEQWEQIGAKVTIETHDTNVLQQRYIRSRDYSILLFGQIVGHDPDPYVFWHSSQRKDPGLNLTSFKDKSADNLLDEARKADSDNDRTLKYLHFQNIVAEEVPAVFLYTPTYLYGLSKDIKGFKLETITSPSERFLNFGEWYIKTDRVWK